MKSCSKTITVSSMDNILVKDIKLMSLIKAANVEGLKGKVLVSIESAPSPLGALTIYKITFNKFSLISHIQNWFRRK